MIKLKVVRKEKKERNMKRTKLLKKMDSWLRENISDEEIFTLWLYSMPDEASDEDYKSIADDDEHYFECMEAFAKIVIMEHEDNK